MSGDDRHGWCKPAGELVSVLHRHDADPDVSSCLTERAPIRGHDAWTCSATGATIVRVPGQSRPWSVDPAHPSLPR